MASLLALRPCHWARNYLVETQRFNFDAAHGAHAKSEIVAIRKEVLSLLVLFWTVSTHGVKGGHFQSISKCH